MDPCKYREPQVINHLMIAKCLEEQGLKGELGRLAREEGIPWDEVLHIRLEFMNILRIDHLWVLPALTELTLSNNIIEKIEALGTLVNLRHLDISFNKISKIENLDELVKLEVFNLFSNRITTLENMDNMKELMIFSIGCNNITDRKNVLYLRRFKKLKSVNMAGNPVTEEEDFRVYIATFLPQILYYEYKLIDSTERIGGEGVYLSQIKEVEAAESVTREREERLEAEAIEAELHSESFVEFLGTSHLFNQMFESDVDGRVFAKINDEAQEYYNEFRSIFMSLATQIFESGQEQYKLRKEEVGEFTAVTEGAKYDNQQESIKLMEEFKDQKAGMYKQVDDDKKLYINKKLTYQDYHLNVAKYKKIYEDKVKATWKILMSLEVILYEQMEELNQVFEQSLTEMINNFIEMAQGTFALMRSAEGTYTEQIGEMLMRLYTSLNISPDITIIPPEAEAYFEDREVLSNAIVASHDAHLLAIDNREDRLMRRARLWLSNLVNDLQKNEITRNRAKVLEITHYLDIQREDFKKEVVLQEITIDL
ncbi:dynein regulatory complex subunit 3-like [Atheta coriaria]|uniref:dynein regulatory complex subunit 3-like n=1 Tax=Dalotia coriaria TaxID=877792 RepID=UPI0031F377D4